jgi:hypothetical protein
VQLTRIEEDMLLGRRGPARKLAMEGLVQLGRAFDAPRMVEIGYAHIHAGMALYLEDIQLAWPFLHRRTSPTRIC